MSARFHFRDPYDEGPGIVVSWNGSVTFNIQEWDGQRWYDVDMFEVFREHGNGLQVEEAFQHARKAAAGYSDDAPED